MNKRKTRLERVRKRLLLTEVEELEKFAKFSPVFDMISNPTPVKIEIVKE